MLARCRISTAVPSNFTMNKAFIAAGHKLKGNINGKVSSIEHTTSAPGVHPAVVLTPGQSTTTTLTFNAALTDPETAAYVCLEKDVYKRQSPYCASTSGLQSTFSPTSSNSAGRPVTVGMRDSHGNGSDGECSVIRGGRPQV